MKTIVFSFKMLTARPLAMLLNVLLLALGLASMTFLILVSHQVETAFERDLAGIDVVVGAKGSPLQLILAGVLHLDVPSGNIPLEAAQALQQHPLVKTLIPLSLGDSYQGFRIVGTTLAYPAHYGARLASGALWAQPMQAVLGADAARRSALAVGAQFAGSHGLAGNGEVHGAALYSVVGILQPCGCVLDRLILTATESVWRVHEKTMALDEADQEALQAEREITLALIQYKSPLAAVTFPRFVNTTTELQAAAPALEISRLLRMLGVGTDVLRGFAAVLLAVAAVSLLIALSSALRERAADLAMLRMLGASPRKIALLLLTETLLLVGAGCLLGLALGHLLTGLVGYLLMQDRSLPVTGWLWLPAEWAVVVAAGALALLAAALPMLRAYRLDVLRLLQAR